MILSQGDVFPNQIATAAPAPDTNTNRMTMFTFRVRVPSNVRPGQEFQVVAGGRIVRVRCPLASNPGQILQIAFPIDRTRLSLQDVPPDKIRLKYSNDGWMRTIRVSDMKFQWTRLDEHMGVLNESRRFDAEHIAYMLKLDFLNDNNRMRRGRVSLVTVDEGAVDSNIKSASGQELVIYSDIARVQVKSYEEKMEWFQNICGELYINWNEGHMRMNVRREHLLSDSMEAVMSLSRTDFRRKWRFDLIGEPGIDELYVRNCDWFELVTEQVFDPDLGLWQTNAANQRRMEINPASDTSCHGDHLVYFRFLGRVMGKAVLDQQLIKCQMAKHIYKFILGWPVMVNDLKDLDEDCYNYLNGFKDILKGLNHMNLTADIVHEVLNFIVVPGGAHIAVPEENVSEYMEACLKHRILGQCEAQMNELLLGFFDAFPAPLLTVFDFHELEWLMCNGLPEIEMSNLQEHTEHTGEADGSAASGCFLDRNTESPKLKPSVLRRIKAKCFEGVAASTKSLQTWRKP